MTGVRAFKRLKRRAALNRRSKYNLLASRPSYGAM
jgi:hypothetical protein